MPGERSGTSVYCEDHGCQVVEHRHYERLLDIKPQVGIEVLDDRHGQRHRALVQPREALERLAGTINGSAILDYVRKVVS